MSGEIEERGVIEWAAARERGGANLVTEILFRPRRDCPQSVTGRRRSGSTFAPARPVEVLTSPEVRRRRKLRRKLLRRHWAFRGIDFRGEDCPLKRTAVNGTPPRLAGRNFRDLRIVYYSAALTKVERRT